MRLLLDTHAFLWFALGDPRLSGPALRQILDPANEKLVSPASYWEIAIKISLGQYSLHEAFEAFMQRAISGNGFHILHVEPHHAAVVASLPFHHRDPFDRLLVAQATAEGIPVLSRDPVLAAYGIPVIW